VDVSTVFLPMDVRKMVWRYNTGAIKLRTQFLVLNVEGERVISVYRPSAKVKVEQRRPNDI
jgi:hypothetical protein